MTRLSRIHPYPAMIADQLASELSHQFVKPGQRVLDPFCGTGRTLMAAAACGADCIGVDINPLAALLTRAKSSSPRPRMLERLLANIPCRTHQIYKDHLQTFDLGRKVEWFSPEVQSELADLIAWINNVHLKRNELYLVASVLSATVREVSYCRDDQWKLHRISEEARSRFFRSPWEVFARRLRYALQELPNAEQLLGTIRVLTGDARQLSDLLKPSEIRKGFDIVLTSPPYGDSRTTVQYGGMSSISLAVLKHLHGLNLDILTGGEIDRRCLGGKKIDLSPFASASFFHRSRYWWGGERNPASDRVRRFLLDLDRCIEEVTKLLRSGGRAVFVIARRSIGGWKLKLDTFLIDAFYGRNVELEDVAKRQIVGKWTPPVINIHGRITGKSDIGRRVNTMREEYILVFRKP